MDNLLGASGKKKTTLWFNDMGTVLVQVDEAFFEANREKSTKKYVLKVVQYRPMEPRARA